jgi:hypothetical protein
LDGKFASWYYITQVLPLVLLYGANWCFASLWAQKKPETFYSPGYLVALFLLHYIQLFAPGANYIDGFFWRRGCFKKQFTAKFAAVFYHINKFFN